MSEKCCEDSCGCFDRGFGPDPWAEKLAKDESKDSGLDAVDSGAMDAYRHMLWSAELARRYGAAKATFMTYGYEALKAPEYLGPSPTDDELCQWSKGTMMDLHNNRLGINIGRDAKSWTEVIARVRSLIEQAIQNPNGYKTIQICHK